MAGFVPLHRHSLARDRTHLGCDLASANPIFSRPVILSPGGCSEFRFTKMMCKYVYVAQFLKLETDGVIKQWDIHKRE